MEGTNNIGVTEMYATHDFGVIDFMDEANFDQFIDLIRGENENEAYSVADLISNHQLNGSFHDPDRSFVLQDSFADSQFFSPAPAMDLFDFNGTANIDHVAEVSKCELPNGQSFLEDQVEETGLEEEEMMDDEGSSGTTTTTSTKPKKGKKADRSRTLVSERKRRGRMKEKLYALRSLVPNITKMDKASIVGDAVLYVQNLQMQAKKLKSEIAGLESSLTGGDKYKLRTSQNANRSEVTSFYPTIKKVLKMDVVRVDERGFYVRIESNKGPGVAVSLYKTLDSLTDFRVQSSNLADTGENYAFTFTLHIIEKEMDISLSNLKLWVASALLNQGFEFETPPS